MSNQDNFQKRRKDSKKFKTGNNQAKPTFQNRNREKAKSRFAFDPSVFVKKAFEKTENKFEPGRTISQMPINPKLKANLTKKGYVIPTEIQDRSLETLFEGKDLLGIAQTGTGKTAAFLIPIIDRLLVNKNMLKALVIVPTRELAGQVEQEFRSMTAGLGLYSACFIGGVSINNDLQKLRKHNHLIVGTPGRLLDLENKNVLQLKSFTVLVLDEFDRMLDMGFIDDMKKIIGAMVNRKQTMLFSATIDKSQQPLISSILTDPVEIKVSSGKSAAESVEQDIIRVGKDEDKFRILLGMLEKDDFGKVLLFTETRRRVDQLCIKLKKSGILAEQIHGEKSQRSRQHALDKFKHGEIQVLVATDVAARGIDVKDITHVINYQVPQNYDSYIHRIGRTGRAGKTGKALTFIN
ncbi:MAG: DEAD/DEAH box helicase [Bacteroidales bacterium]